MEYVCMAAALALAGVCCRLEQRLRRLEKKLDEQQRIVEAAEDALREQSDRDRETARTERLFREGLRNILNYGVT